MRSQSRVDDAGRAFAGSQLQIQLYSARRPTQLEAALVQALTRVGDRLHWRAPLEGERFAEPKDAAFLTSLGLSHFASDLAAYWPSSGPRWDGLATLAPSDTVLLLEGKSYPAEMRGSGCQAKDPDSLTRIRAVLDGTKAWLGVDPGADWMGALNQYANRLAHVRFLRERGVDAWLVNLCFTDDKTTTPTTAEAWRQGLADVKRELGVPNLDDVVADVLLPALSPETWEAP